jgi:hypothetical protein
MAAKGTVESFMHHPENDRSWPTVLILKYKMNGGYLEAAVHVQSQNPRLVSI